MKSISVLIVDDISDTRKSIRRLLQFESNIEVVGEAGTGSDALRLAEELKPDIVLLDINMPEMDGLRATELLVLRVPESAVIIMSVQGEPGYMRRAMLSGAREYLVKPFSGSELASAIVNVNQIEKQKKEARGAQSATQQKENIAFKGQIISFFSTKGGVGKTTIATNLAVQLANSGKWRVLLVDLNLQFGDVGVFLNMLPKKTIADLAQASSLLYSDIQAYLLTHASGLEVLIAPSRPEYAEYVTAEQVNQILTEVKTHFDYIICDNVSRFDDISLASLDVADQIWLVVTQDISTLKNIKLSLEVLEGLHYTDKIHLILNRSGNEVGIQFKDIEKSLNFPIAFEIPSDGKALVTALNKGTPFVLSYPQSKPAEGIRRMVESLTKTQAASEVEIKEKQSKRFLGHLKGLSKVFDF
ncbi:MAG: response regulator [Desulfitobacteriaceae bacterium]